MPFHFLRFFQEEKGVAAPIIALSFTALLSAVGAAVDYGHAQMVQTKLADTLDAAGLAAGATLSSKTPATVAQNYFKVNFPQGYLNATVSPLTVTQNAQQTKLTLTASATVPSTFMGLVGIKDMKVTASTEITRKAGGLELILVMDNTGSMEGQKLASLKSAATELVNILFGDDAVKEKVWIGLVPFSQAVNIGTNHASWLNTAYTQSLDWGTTSWAGCTDARTGGKDITDDPPSSQLFKAYYWPTHASYNNWKTVSSKGKVTYAKGLGPDLGPNKYCSQPVSVMSNVKSTILAGINSMQARGNTHINLGAVWGWRMLSPQWKGLWGGTMNANNLPLDYNTPNMTKVMVLLSDGDNTISNSVRGAYGYLSDGVLGTTNSNTAVTKLNNKLASVCTSLKGHGVKIFTILYDMAGTNSTAQKLFEDCATEGDYFFNSPSASELEEAFQQIGDSLSNLRISK
jgi:Flp pilus assembly protein TadG